MGKIANTIGEFLWGAAGAVLGSIVGSLFEKKEEIQKQEIIKAEKVIIKEQDIFLSTPAITGMTIAVIVVVMMLIYIMYKCGCCKCNRGRNRVAVTNEELREIGQELKDIKSIPWKIKPWPRETKWKVQLELKTCSWAKKKNENSKKQPIFYVRKLKLKPDPCKYNKIFSLPVTDPERANIISLVVDMWWTRGRQNQTEETDIE